MENRWYCGRWRRRRASRLAGLLAALVLGAAGVQADVPDWLRAAAQLALPEYPEETEAVLLLDEQETTVKDNGEIKTRYRRAYKILRPGGRDYGRVVVWFDNETRLTYLKAWSLPAEGKPYEVKEKEAIETSPFDIVLYQDNRQKVLRIPAAEPGNIIGYEYEQKRRPFILQDRWYFQDPLPVRQGRYLLELPSGWEFEAVWKNHAAQEPQAAGPNRWVWELENVPAIEPEPAMPVWQAVAGWLAVNYFPRREGLRAKSYAAWRDVGAWYAGLAAARRAATPAIQQKVAELAAGASSTLGKIRALARFVQQKVRYVAIEIGIGGYQPHAAADVFSNLYGDCKDKATLLSTMLEEIGIKSYYVLIHTRRGVVAPDFPSPLGFNHAILAIRLPAEVESPSLYAAQQYEGLGRLLFFDPTHSLTPLGLLPGNLQANRGLVVTQEGGVLLELPLLAPATNRILRSAKFGLNPDGTLFGTVQEILWGGSAAERRALLLGVPAAERQKTLERFLANFLAGFLVQDLAVENLEDTDQTLVVRYRFVANHYAKTAGNLLLLRPRVLGEKGSDILEEKKKKERKYPVEFETPSLESDIFEIALPGGFVVEELPPAVTAEAEFADYRSRVEVAPGLLRYLRLFQVKQVRVPTERLGELKNFYRQIDADERQSAVLKRSAP